MPIVRVLPHAGLCPDGDQFEVGNGASLCKALIERGVAIEHSCEMVAACATCHVHIRDGAEFLRPPDDEESDQLDQAWGLDAQSRLACCVKIRNGDLTIELPRHTRNHVRGH